jgi:hypothetical protein
MATSPRDRESVPINPLLVPIHEQASAVGATLSAPWMGAFCESVMELRSAVAGDYRLYVNEDRRTVKTDLGLDGARMPQGFSRFLLPQEVAALRPVVQGVLDWANRDLDRQANGWLPQSPGDSWSARCVANRVMQALDAEEMFR